MSRSDPRHLAALIPLLLLSVSACGPKLTPEEEIELLRSQYTAELKSLTVKQDPVTAAPDAALATDANLAPDTALEPTPDMALEPGATEEESLEAETEEASDAAENEAAGADPSAGVADAPAPAVRTDVILDILVSTTGQKYLPGVTLDVEHVDESRREKDRRTLWVDTSSLVRGGGVQVTHALENVDWEAGDGFFVEVRTPIPAEERADYREFQSD